MKNKLRIAVAVISASVMVTVFFAACGGVSGPGNVQLAQVTDVNLVPATPGVSRAGSVSFALYLAGNEQFLQTPSANVVWTVAGEDADGNPVALHHATALNTVDNPMAGHAHRNPDLDEILYDGDHRYGKTHDNRQVILAAHREELSEYLIVTAATNLPGGAANNRAAYVRLPVAAVLGVVREVNLSAAGVLNAHRDSAAGPLTGRFNFSVFWNVYPSTYDVPEDERNRATWSIISGASAAGTHGPGAAIDADTGALTIPRGQAPGANILTIRATSVFDSEQYATIQFTVNAPVVETVTVEGAFTPLERGQTRTFTASVSGIGYPQDLPRPMQWQIVGFASGESVITANTNNNLTAVLAVSHWEPENEVVIRATDAQGEFPFGQTDRITLTGELRIGAFSRVRVGDYHILARDWDFGLWAWGRNDHGQTGIGEEGQPVRTPTRVGNDNNWREISGGEMHSLGIRQDGTLWSWGRGDRGALGLGSGTVNVFNTFGQNQAQVSVPQAIGTATVRSTHANAPASHTSPQQVGSASDWSYASAGASFGIFNVFTSLSTALREDGTVWTWGTNMNGQAGVGSTNNPYMLQVSPRQALNPANRRWRAVEAGRVASVAAICTDGFLYTWGANSYGELGRNLNATTSSPQRVNHPVNSSITWRSVSAGLRFMVAVDQYGEMWSWGQNTYGKLGRGGNHAPDRVVFPQGYAPRFNEVSISQGTQHVLALDTEHRLWAWGRNANGQIGNGSTGGTSTPVMVTVPEYGITQWFSANAGAEFSVAISRSLTHENNGIIFTWGQNTFGQMGNPSLTANNYNTPQRLDIAR